MPGQFTYSDRANHPSVLAKNAEPLVLIPFLYFYKATSPNAPYDINL